MLYDYKSNENKGLGYFVQILKENMKFLKFKQENMQKSLKREINGSKKYNYQQQLNFSRTESQTINPFDVLQIITQFISFHFLINQNIFNQIQIYIHCFTQKMTSNQSSHEALSDPLPRLYSCFCDKIFTTYPGIYLHLKSKHSNLFQKYKKLKITKLFKKVKDQKGNQIYRLDKLSEKDSAHSYIYQKKGRENSKKKNYQENYEKNGMNREDSEINKPQFSMNPFHNAYHYRNQELYSHYMYPFKNQAENQKQYLEKINNFHPSIYSSSYYNLSYNQGINNYPPFFNPFYQQFSAQNSQLSTKRIFQQYLSMAFQKKVENFTQIKNSLYDLMVFIDKNYEIINDPRIKGRDNIFSYCDQFEPRFLGNLIKQYIELLKKNLQENTIQNDVINEKKSEIKHIEKFVNWLKELNFIQILPQAIIIDEKQIESQKRQNIENLSESQGFLSKDNQN